jgi:aminoglycoside phosphotransferase (APT) family kinase protein
MAGDRREDQPGRAPSLNGPPVDISDAALQAILRRHGLDARAITPFAHAGRDAAIFFLGADLALRIPLGSSGMEVVEREAIAIPAARAAGAQAPRLVAVGRAGEVTPFAYTLLERTPGVALNDPRQDAPVPAAVWEALGRDLGRLHAGVERGGPAGALWPAAEPEDPDPRPWLAELIAAGRFPASEGRWLSDRLEALAAQALTRAPWCFTHGDINAGNVMVAGAPLRYRALLDWGGAGWSDPAWDFAGVSLHVARRMLAGHRAIAPLSADATAEARIFWRHTQLALFSMRRGAGWTPERLADAARRLVSGAQAFLEPGAAPDAML